MHVDVYCKYHTIFQKEPSKGREENLSMIDRKDGASRMHEDKYKLAEELYLGNKEIEKVIAERMKKLHASRLDEYYPEEILPVGQIDSRGYMFM